MRISSAVGSVPTIHCVFATNVSRILCLTRSKSTPIARQSSSSRTIRASNRFQETLIRTSTILGITTRYLSISDRCRHVKSDALRTNFYLVVRSCKHLVSKINKAQGENERKLHGSTVCTIFFSVVCYLLFGSGEQKKCGLQGQKDPTTS